MLESEAADRKVDRRRFLLGTTVLGAASALGGGAPMRLAQAQISSAAQKPNILFMLVDNLGYGELGIYGGGATRGAPTPRIDKLASEGLRLTNMNMEAQCTPSRSAILTGRYGVADGLTQWEVTMAEALSAAGYATALYGKWHLGSHDGRLPNDQGFDEWYGIPRTTDEALWPGSWNSAWEQQAEDLYGYQPAKAKALLQEAGYAQGFAFTVYLYTLPGLPELLDIGQALALDWEAIGLKPKLVEVEFPRVREQYRTKAIHGAVWPGRASPNAFNFLRIYNKATESAVYAYEHPAIEARLAALDTVVEPAARGRLLREIGDHKFQEFAEMPLFWLYAEAGVHPKYVAEYIFPGSITGFLRTWST